MKHSLILKNVFLSCFIIFITSLRLLYAAESYQQLNAQAEKLYSQGSYALTLEFYLKADKTKLPKDEQRWVDFRIADTSWRAQAATQTSDSTQYDKAQKELEKIISEVSREEEKDKIWTEAVESLADFWWMRRDSQNWQEAWKYYEQALNWWGASSEIETARKRYLKIIWKIAEPPHRTVYSDYYPYGYYCYSLPLEILDNGLKIAKTDNDRAGLHYLIAMRIKQGGYGDDYKRAAREFEEAIKGGPLTEWYDDVLYHYGEWLANYGRVVVNKQGGWQYQQDYVHALEIFRRLLQEYQKGETRYYDSAKQNIENITKPSLQVSVSNIFLPDSEIQFNLNWRNIQRIDFSLYKVNLTRDTDLYRSEGTSNWLDTLKLSWDEKVISWTKDVINKGDYKPGQEIIPLENKLPLGAYILEAKSGGVSSRELILVTDVSLVVKTAGKQALVYFCNAISGSPVSSADVVLWERHYKDNKYIWNKYPQKTNNDGITVFDLTTTSSSRDIFVTANLGEREAFSTGYSYNYYQKEEQWRIYAFTDRPAYRPREEVNWKFIARKYNDSVYNTPAKEIIEFLISDPRGSKVDEGKVSLNEFGSTFGSFKLTEGMPLGEYRVTFWDEGRKNNIGTAALFRLEEYKLPEFKVNVRTGEEGGKKKTFRLGDKVTADITAEYYFGGGVSNANVEVLIYQRPFYHWWHPAREFNWYYNDIIPLHSSFSKGGMRGDYGWNGYEQIIKRETIKTDSSGKAVISFDTLSNSQQDFEYRIEARVTDSSRREIIGSDTIRVTKQSYYVYLNPQHNLYRPQDKVQINIKTLDANEQPVVTEGEIVVTRDFWQEIWIDAQGKEISGDDIKRGEGKAGVLYHWFGQRDNPYKLKFQGYKHEEVIKRTIKTDSEGNAEFTFTPEREGYYRISWVSESDESAPIKSESFVWVTTNTTTDLGYRQGGVEIIVDKDTFKAGEKAVVMLNVPTNDRYVLFSVEGDDLYSYELIHLGGTAKLIYLSIEEKHIPNIYLSAAMVTDHNLHIDTKQVIIPPVKQFLNVEVFADKKEYQPREVGNLSVKVKDNDGRPVSGELSLALVDESVYYIQEDYAQDIRQFFYGQKRQNLTNVQSSFQQKMYAKLIKGENEQLIDEKSLEREKRDGFVVGGRAGGKDFDESGYRNDIGGEYAEDGAAKEEKLMKISEIVSGTARSRLELEDNINSPRSISVDKTPLVSQSAEPAVVVRSDFRTTVLWEPRIITDKNGEAHLKATFPDSLTTWRLVSRVATGENQFGIATSSTKTKQPLIVRLQAPRFFVVGDLATVSAVINNNTDEEIDVRRALQAEGVIISGMMIDGKIVKAEDNGLSIVPPQGEARVDWVVYVEKSGQAKLKVTARGDKYSDAMDKIYPIYEHGIKKLIAKSGKLRESQANIELVLPKERKKETTNFIVQISPSLTVTMLDALPYLIDYPYGCTEQTMSRFLPAAITVKTLENLGLDRSMIMNKIFGGIEKEYTAKTHPEGRKDFVKLDEMVKQGLTRLYDFQHSDGGWGWWKEGESDHFMSAYVLWGLTLAYESGIEVRRDAADRAVKYLNEELVEEENNYDNQSWMLHSLSVFHSTVKGKEITSFEEKAFSNLWENKDKLNAYSRALFALSAYYFGYLDKAKILADNLVNGVKIDTESDTSILNREQLHSDTSISTAHWGEDGIYYRWSDGGVEATSFVLRALLLIEPDNKLIEPTVNWLIKNRRGAQWSNTRDTAITVLTLTDYLIKSGELGADLEYELSVNGNFITKDKINRQDVLNAPSQFVIDNRFIKDGINTITLHKKGNNPLYFSAYAKFFSLEEPIEPAGNEIFVKRQYYKLVGRPTLLKGYTYEKMPLGGGDSIKSGERVEVVVTIEAKNNYEYLVFEDLKPAGFEAVQIKSGEPLYAKELKSGVVDKLFDSDDKSEEVDSSDYTSRQRWVYQELRDRKVALFIDKLPQGTWQIRYELRAETPGKFHALPVAGYAMYVPEIKCNGREIMVNVEDSE